MIRRTLLLGLGAFAVAPNARADGPPLPPALDALSPLAVTLPDGAAATLGDYLAPAPSVISFWATWCAPCVAEARHLARVRVRYPAAALNIVGINVDRRRDEDQIARFLTRTGATYTQLRAEPALYAAFGGSATQIALPRCFVFAADGRAVAAFGRYNGAATLRAIDRAIEGVAGPAR